MVTSRYDPAQLDRFVAAQASSYDVALGELRRGRKTGHWMWYVFPQIAGLGSSDMARHYAIGSPAEAAAYLDHPVLGPRYRACVAALQALSAGLTAEAVLGGIDAVKLRSSLTLFRAVHDEPSLGAALDRWFGGAADDRTLALLAAMRRTAPRT